MSEDLVALPSWSVGLLGLSLWPYSIMSLQLLYCFPFPNMLRTRIPTNSLWGIDLGCMPATQKFVFFFCEERFYPKPVELKAIWPIQTEFFLISKKYFPPFFLPWLISFSKIESCAFVKLIEWWLFYPFRENHWNRHVRLKFALLLAAKSIDLRLTNKRISLNFSICRNNWMTMDWFHTVYRIVYPSGRDIVEDTWA